MEGEKMPKRVGITSNLDRRKKEWGRKFKIKKWSVISTSLLTYEGAQKIEDRYKKRGYIAHSGGRKKSGKVYSVYTFNY